MVRYLFELTFKSAIRAKRETTGKQRQDKCDNIILNSSAETEAN